MCMNKSIISEALGVPEGIVNSAILVYEKILDEVKRTRKNVKGMNIVVDLPRKDHLKIGEHYYKKIDVTLNFHPVQEEFELAGMAIRGNIKLSNTHILKFDKKESDTINLSVDFATGKKWGKKDLVNYLIENRNTLIPILSHELKHGYDMIKRKFYTAKEHSLYQSKTGTYYNIDPIDKFIISLYYISNIENLVRPSEVAAAIDLNKIQKKDFLEFLLSNDVYNRLKTISSFDFDKMKKDIYNHLPRVYEIINQQGWEVKNDDQAVSVILKSVMTTLGMKALDTYVNVLSNKPEEKIFGLFSPEKRKIMDKFYNEVTRFGDNYEAFFKYEIKNMRETAGKMIKKISKLYDYIQEVTPNDEKSIRNWDLHHKINKQKNEQYFFEMKSLKEYLKSI